MLADAGETAVFQAISDLAIFFLMMLAGMELRPKDMAGTSGRATWIAAGGVALPVGVGFLVAWVYVPYGEDAVAQGLIIDSRPKE